MQLYRLQFVPSNALGLGSCIVIKPPGNFQVVANSFQLVVIESGLYNQQEDNPVLVTIAGGELQISNYAAVRVGSLVSVRVRLLNPPSTYGPTSAISILTY